MTPEEKKKHLQTLLENETYKTALSSAPDDVEREKISAFAQDVFLSLIEGISTVEAAIRENPEKMAEVIAKHIPKK